MERDKENTSLFSSGVNFIVNSGPVSLLAVFVGTKLTAASFRSDEVETREVFVV
jgi:hypothetical protein